MRGAGSRQTDMYGQAVRAARTRGARPQAWRRRGLVRRDSPSRPSAVGTLLLKVSMKASLLMPAALAACSSAPTTCMGTVQGAAEARLAALTGGGRL